MLNEKPFHIDGPAHASASQTYVERHEFRDRSRPERFRRARRRRRGSIRNSPLADVRTRKREACGESPTLTVCGFTRDSIFSQAPMMEFKPHRPCADSAERVVEREGDEQSDLSVGAKRAGYPAHGRTPVALHAPAAHRTPFDTRGRSRSRRTSRTGSRSGVLRTPRGS